MKGIISVFFIVGTMVFSNNIHAQQSGDLESLVEQLKKEAIENRAILEQFVDPEMLDKIMESLDEVDIEDFKSQMEGINLGDFLNEDLLNSPLLKGLSLDNLNLNEILNSDFFDLFNFSLPDAKEIEEEGKVKI